jgi:Zn-finger domain-containing protein
MDANGYTAPFRSLNRYGVSSSTDIGFEEVSEINRHNQHFRLKATAKRNILDRVKAAIDAHKIAIGNLEAYGRFKCLDCGKSYRSSTFENIENIKCVCGSENLKFEVDETEVYRLEIIPYLPLSGNYMVLMSELTEWGRDSLKKVLNLLKTKRKAVVTNVSPVISVKDNNRWITKRISLDSEFVDSYEEELRRQYGKNFRIERLDFHRSRPTIINDKHTRTALTIAYVKYSESIVEKHHKEILSRNIRKPEYLKIYDEVVHDVKLDNPNLIGGLDTLEEWRNHKVTEILQDIGLMDNFGHLDRTLKSDIKRRDQIEQNIYSEIAPTLIRWDIFKYYLTTSNDRRKRFGGPFPYIRGDIDRQQRKIFQKNPIKVINLLKELENEKIISVPDMDLLLYKKFNLEEQIKNSNIKLNYSALGAAMISTNSEISVKESAEIFNVSEELVEKEIKKIETSKRPRSKKSKKFLEMIKK